MITQIQTSDDVKIFAKEIIADGVSFHSDDDFKDYVYFRENKRCYTDEEAGLKYDLMDLCFNVCDKEGVDIYYLMLKVTLKETGMDKYFPLPSASFSNNKLN